MADKTTKTEEMQKYESETGKNAIWNEDVTKSFLKWQKGERLYDIDKERVALYIPKVIKEKWLSFAESNNYSTLSKLIREALGFYIQHKSSPTNSKLDTLSSKIPLYLSHDLKERLTAIMAYVQFLFEDDKFSHDSDVNVILEKIFSQCLSFEEFITNNFENLNQSEDKNMNKKENDYDILIIEDNIETSNFLERYFKSLGYSCKEARSGRKGLELIKESKPSIIFLDIILPDISGYDVLESIKSDITNKDIHIIFLTAMPKSEGMKKMKELGADGLITKPFNLNDFEIIDKILSKPTKSN